MKFLFMDTVSEETLLAVQTPNEEFAMNIFNLFMVQMIDLHGSSFAKLSSDALGPSTILISYTNNIICHLEPKS